MHMSDDGSAVPPAPILSIRFGEFIVLIALLMALTALSIDIMLPSLPEIGAVFGVANPNDRQLVVSSYLLGLAAGQLLWGPMSDRLGRKRPLIIGLVLFTVASVASVAVTSFSVLILARLVQGFGGAAARVIALAVVRDLFTGRQMARVMSTVMMVFIMVPIFAPAVGQGLAHAGGWSLAFYVLIFAGVLAAGWSALRLPETLPPSVIKTRVSISLGAALAKVVRQPTTLGYGIASGFVFGTLVTYIASAQQVFVDVYDLGSAFPIAFGSVAFSMALAAFTNSRLVQRIGMRRLSHTALFAFLGVSSLMIVLAAFGKPPLMVTGLLLASVFYLFGLIQPNFNAIAMQPVGDVAGMASSLFGFYTTAAGAILGSMIARQFNGTVLPLAIGFLTLGTGALVCVLLVEGRGGLFRGE
jgi:DHA1 family bicyclomycin/chloramphenicol resistance-like MFS transporter